MTFHSDKQTDNHACDVLFTATADHNVANANCRWIIPSTKGLSNAPLSWTAWRIRPARGRARLRFELRIRPAAF